jgi:hypothetical protein
MPELETPAFFQFFVVSLRLTILFMFSSFHYECLRVLAILGENVVGADLSDRLIFKDMDSILIFYLEYL